MVSATLTLFIIISFIYPRPQKRFYSATRRNKFDIAHRHQDTIHQSADSWENAKSQTQPISFYPPPNGNVIRDCFSYSSLLIQFIYLIYVAGDDEEEEDRLLRFRYTLYTAKL